MCGAGINAVGVAPDGRVTRYLALGTISGEWGGGYGLGLEVLWHAARAEDGRGPDTMLTRHLTSHFGVEQVEEITIGIHQGKIDDDELIGLAPLLLRAADEGDPVARAVVNRLAGEISVMAITAMRRLGLTGLATPVILGGGVITARNPLLMDGITRQLAEAAPRAQVRGDRRTARGWRRPPGPGPGGRPARRRGPPAGCHDGSNPSPGALDDTGPSLRRVVVWPANH